MGENEELAASRPGVGQQLLSSPIAPQTIIPNNISHDTALSSNAGVATSIAPSVINLPFSLSTLRDWLKLILIGGTFETCRKLFTVLYQKLKRFMFVTAKFEDTDDSFDWMMHWLLKHPSLAKLRDLTVTTKSGRTSTLTMREDVHSQSNASNKDQLNYLPSFATSAMLWYKRHLLWVSREERAHNGIMIHPYRERREQSLIVRVLAFNNNILNQIISEAKANYLASIEDTISIYTYDMHMFWRKLADRPKRPLNSIILDPGVKDALIADAQDFLSSKAWYATRGIPFRRGYLLYGAPGSGKTSLIHSLAGELGLKIYVISLSHPDLTDTSLRQIMTSLPERCVALVEDIDAAFIQNMNRDLSNEDSKDPSKNQNPPSKITLSGLLNVLDGIGAAEGRILFATTNKYSSLDSALCRPGRMDVHVEFRLASQFQASELYKVFYLPESELQDSDSDKDKCANASDSVDLAALLAASSDSIIEHPNINNADGVSITGMLHQQRAPQLSRKALTVLAGAFSESIPEREISMAALQGYLMQYKTHPVEAVKNAKKWVINEKESQAKRQNGNNGEASKLSVPGSDL